MENFVPNPSLYEAILEKSNKDKAFTYKQIFMTLDEMNLTPEIEYKIDPSYLEQELMFIVINSIDDDDFMFMLDSRMKEIILNMLSQNLITISQDVPLYILADILESYMMLYNVADEFGEELLDIVSSEDIENPSFTFSKLINEYASCGYGNLSYYLTNVDQDVIENLKKRFELQVEDVSSRIPGSYVRNIALFAVRYKVDSFISKHLLNLLKVHKIFNRPFREIFPLVNGILIENTEIGQEEYVDLVCLGYLASSEGFDNINGIIDTLKDNGLLSFGDMNPSQLSNLILNRVKELKK